MTFPILGGNSAVGGYAIDNSLRFNDDDSAYLSRTPSGSGTTGTWTFSCWVKRGVSSTNNFVIFSSGAVNQRGHIYLYSDNFIVQPFNSTGASAGRITEAVFRDHSAWYHFLAVANGITTANLATNLDVYVNGIEVSTIATGSGTPTGGDRINDGQVKMIGQFAPSSGSYFDGYMAEFNFIDGQALSPTDFGEFDEDSGIWKPKAYEGTYTGNSFYLDFENSGSLGADVSGLGNNFTPTNLASTDQTTDTPTNNFATMNPLILGGSITTSEGNTTTSKSTTAFKTFYGTVPIPTSGKFYWEVVETSSSSGDVLVGICVVDGTLSTNVDTYPTDTLTSYCYYSGGGNFNYGPGNVNVGFGATWGQNDVIGILFDADAGTLTFYKNGVSQGTPYTGLTAQYIPVFGTYLNGTTLSVNFGNPSFSISSGNSDANGYGNFEYSPSGGLALCTQNLATELSPTIDDGSQYFNTLTWTGNGSNPRSFTGLGFQPDFTWHKVRSTSASHMLYDSTRGVGKRLHSNQTVAEATETAEGTITSFDSDGFTLDEGTSNDFYVNDSGVTYVAWNWSANAGSTSSNTDGSITSTVQANTTAGFSIVTYTGTGALATVGHGLGITPKMIIWKRRDSATNWSVQGTQSGINTDQTEIVLNSTGTVSGVDSRLSRQSQWNSTTFEVNTYGDQNASGGTFVAYCFADVEGYSKFGSYIGNGNGTNTSADGTFVYLGFKPSWVMVKASTVAQSWTIFDNKRDNYNVADKFLYANTSDAETTGYDAMDFLSNGFKLRKNLNGTNDSDQTFIYMAFAKHPFVSSTGIPVTAR
jgi:hypothetical protein